MPNLESLGTPAEIENHDDAGPTGDDSGNSSDRAQSEVELLTLITDCLDRELEREWANNR